MVPRVGIATKMPTVTAPAYNTRRGASFPRGPLALRCVHRIDPEAVSADAGFAARYAYRIRGAPSKAMHDGINDQDAQPMICRDKFTDTRHTGKPEGADFFRRGYNHDLNEVVRRELSHL